MTRQLTNSSQMIIIRKEMVAARLFPEPERSPGQAQRAAMAMERLRHLGWAVTPQRLSILRVVADAKDHPRAETVFERVRREHPHISLATVHRTLERLAAAGEVCKVTPLHDSARYDGNSAPHHHVVCVRCREVQDVEVAEFDHHWRGIEQIGEFKVLGVALEVRALCAACQQKTEHARSSRRIAR